MPPKELVDEIEKAYNEYKKEKEKEVDYLTFYNGFVACNRNRQQENSKLLDVINNQDVKIADLEKENKKLDRALITSTKNNIERQKIIDSLQAEKEKEKMQIIANYSDKEEGLRRKIFKLEQQIEKMKRHCNCKHRDSEGYCEVRRTYLIDLSYDGCDKWELED